MAKCDSSPEGTMLQCSSSTLQLKLAEGDQYSYAVHIVITYLYISVHCVWVHVYDKLALVQFLQVLVTK